MRFKCICIAITILFLAREGISQECPDLKGEKTAVQFLVDHKANSTAENRHCVDGAFIILGSATGYRNKNYIKFLVGMLDFERWTPEEYAQASEQKYPAINELHHLYGLGKNVVPYLIRGIKESDSEALQANAAETLYYIYASKCKALGKLTQESEKADIPSDQKLRLEDAAKHIDQDLAPLSPSCGGTHSDP
jgi:hypothetical protein